MSFDRLDNETVLKMANGQLLFCILFIMSLLVLLVVTMS